MPHPIRNLVDVYGKACCCSPVVLFEDKNAIVRGDIVSFSVVLERLRALI
jgi:hypothetical protein